VRSAVFTLRREVGGDYAQDVGRYLDLQRNTILGLAQRFDLQVMAQGEIEEKQILWGSAEQRQAAVAELRRIGWLRGDGDPMEALYDGRLFYSDVVADIERFVAARDLVLGYRLHGNLLAIANGVPSVYFTYDSRTVEFAETLSIPSFDVFGDQPFRLEEFWEQSRFERFNRAYYARYRDMRLFLDENGIAHKMVDETQSLPKLLAA
jgi:hypothetical protein